MILPDTQVVPWKKGDYFSVQCQYLDDAGAEVDIVALGISVASQVRKTDGQLVSTLTVTMGVMGAFEVSGPTAAWPFGDLLWDIQYTQAGRPFSTENIILRVYRGATA